MNRQHDRSSSETEPLLRRITDGDMSSSAPEPSPVETGADAAIARRVVKKIDRVIIPLLFVTYMLNFMDKVILSSAAVFGLREDTVRNLTQPPRAIIACKRESVGSLICSIL